MFGSDILDVAIGLVFVYLMLSLICSVLNEWIAALFSMRSNNLEDGIRNLLKDSADDAGPEAVPIADRVYSHALISGLYRPGLFDRLFKRPGRPSYIHSRTFALALLDVIAPSEMSGTQTVADIRQAVENLPEGRAREALLTLINNSQNDVQAVRQNIENWFNDSMDRVSGWYKRKSQIIILCLALAIATIANADSVVIVNSLRHNPALRASAVAAAEAYVKEPTNAPPATTPAATVTPVVTTTPAAATPLANPAATATPAGAAAANTPAAATTPATAGTPSGAVSTSTNAPAGADAPAPTRNPLDRIREIEQKLEPLHLPIGWITAPKPPELSGTDAEKAAALKTYTVALETYRSDPRKFPGDLGGWLTKLFGLFLTGVALSLGAPFWFDVLNKFIVIRSTVKPREKSPDEASKDSGAVTTEEPLPPAPQHLNSATVTSTSLVMAPWPPALGGGAGEAAPTGGGTPSPVRPTGAQLFELGVRHLHQTYILGARVPLDNAGWQGPWDCAEFVSWCVYQLTGKLYGCSNNNTEPPGHTESYTGWWGRDARAGVVEQITVKQATNTLGAVLLRLPQPNMNGHIVISDGRGGTVEAHSKDKGVIRGEVKGRRWDMGIRIPGFNYNLSGADASAPPPDNIYRLTTPYMKGAQILVLQQRLKDAGIDPGTIDGEYGPKTAAAVYAYQLREGLLPDGEYGPDTAAKLGLNLAAPPQLPHYPGIDMGDYPGDAVMDAIYGHPYRFTGYYLSAPCHRDANHGGHWRPWMGHRQHLLDKGWGLIVCYVGQQAPGASKCGANTLTRSQGMADAEDAITKARGDGFKEGVIIFLDIERMDTIPLGMLEYARAWVGRLLDEGMYKPGIYCHNHNVGELAAATRQEFAARGLPNESPAFWVVRIWKNRVFDPEADSPADSGVPYAAVWQGRIDISKTINGVAVKSLDENTATSNNPSRA
ncbi:MAG TPA: glycoside hydrolase domain-containing protein [Pyrinomonadaceae bacterium]|jgi:hypothetical protein